MQLSYSHIRVGASLGFDMEFHNSIIKQIREERIKKKREEEIKEEQEWEHFRENILNSKRFLYDRIVKGLIEKRTREMEEKLNKLNNDFL